MSIPVPEMLGKDSNPNAAAAGRPGPVQWFITRRMEARRGSKPGYQSKNNSKKQAKKIKEHKWKKAGGRSIGSTDMQQSTDFYRREGKVNKDQVKLIMKDWTITADDKEQGLGTGNAEKTRQTTQK